MFTTFTKETAFLAGNALKAIKEGHYDVAEQILPGFGMFFFAQTEEERLVTIETMVAALRN